MQRETITIAKVIPVLRANMKVTLKWNDHFCRKKNAMACTMNMGALTYTKMANCGL